MEVKPLRLTTKNEKKTKKIMKEKTSKQEKGIFKEIGI